MKKNLKIGLILVIVAVLVLALTSTAMAGKRDDFHLTFNFEDVDWDHLNAHGIFDLTGDDYSDTGSAYLYWYPAKIDQPVMILDGGNGRITMAISLSHREIDETAVPVCFGGTVVFKALRGTDYYEGLMGQGEIDMCFEKNDADVVDRIFGTIDARVKYIPNSAEE
ncbi:hypothetical protein ACFLZW_07205 [Chloroflexota bacterium]